MLERGQVTPDLRQTPRVNVPNHHAGALVAFGEYHTPRIDEQAVPVRAPAVVVQAALRRGEHVALVLDRTRAKQYVPVRRAGHRRERGGDDDQSEVAEVSIELREPQVVAHRQRDAAARSIERHWLGSRLDRPSLVVVLIALGESEEVNLVVARGSAAVRIEDGHGAAHPRRVGDR